MPNLSQMSEMLEIVTWFEIILRRSAKHFGFKTIFLISAYLHRETTSLTRENIYHFIRIDYRRP